MVFAEQAAAETDFWIKRRWPNSHRCLFAVILGHRENSDSSGRTDSHYTKAKYCYLRSILLCLLMTSKHLTAQEPTIPLSKPIQERYNSGLPVSGSALVGVLAG